MFRLFNHKFTQILVLFLAGCSNEKSKNEKDLIKPLLLTGIVSYNSRSGYSDFAVTNIDLSKFLGTWKEMRRIENGFQTGLYNVSVNYTNRGDGSVGVLNTGSFQDGRSSSISGIALVPDPTRGILKVSFFYPFFFGDFLILDVDKVNYKTALIGGPSSDILWIFSRDENIDSTVEQNYIQKAKGYGYETNRLVRF